MSESRALLASASASVEDLTGLLDYGSSPSDSRQQARTLNTNESSTNLPRKIAHFMKSSRAKLFASYFLSSWVGQSICQSINKSINQGDRLWTFALGLVLTELGGNLQLTAVSGFANGIVSIAFGAAIGRLIDRSNRLKGTVYGVLYCILYLLIPAAILALVLNNLFVSISAGLLAFVLIERDNAAESSTSVVDSSNSPMFTSTATMVCTWLSIAVCAASVLAGRASKIIVAKDWACVCAEGDNDRLACELGPVVLVTVAWDTVTFFIISIERLARTYRPNSDGPSADPRWSDHDVDRTMGGLRIYSGVECRLVLCRVRYATFGVQGDACAASQETSSSCSLTVNLLSWSRSKSKLLSN